MPTPDVRVRLSAEGAKEVVDLFKRLNRESTAAARSAGGAFDGVGRSVSRLKGLLGTLGIGVTVAGIVGMAKASLDAADQVGKFADKIGSTAERVSTLKQVAAENDVEFEALQTSLFAFVRNLDALGDGTKEQVKAFKALGLSASDFTGKDTIQAFDLVAQQLGKMESGTRRTQLALDVLGKQGANLIPIMQALAEDGFAAAEQRARELGVLISGDLVNAASQADDALDVLKAQAGGIANAFVSGLAPSIVAVMKDFAGAVDGDGVKKMQAFGRETGRVIRTVIETFRLLARVIGTVFSSVGDNIGATFAALAAAFRGDFAGAVDIVRSRFRQLIADGKQLGTEIGEGAARIVQAATSDAPELAPPKKRDDNDAPTRDTSDPEADARAAAKAKREADARQKLFDDQRKLEQDAREISIETSNEIVALTGREREAKIAALDEEIRRRQLILALAGQLGDREKASLERFRTLSVARIDFEDLKQQGESALEALDRERTRIQQSVDLGLITQLQGQTELIRIERERLAVLQQLAAALAKAAAATGDPALIAQAEQFGQAVRNVEVALVQATDVLARFKQAGAEALKGGLEDFFVNLTDGAASVGSAFKSLASTVVNALQRMAAEALATKILGFLSGFSGFGFLGGAVKAARGGLITGPGSDRSDNIPALLSPGEYVIRAAAVRQIGVDVLRSINRGVRLPAPSVPSVGRYADGGFVRPGAAATGGGTKIVNVLDPSLVSEALGTAAGERAIVNVIKRNPGLIRRAIG